MATYKVLQDIEAEDKFLGPLTLKQFIFAAIGFVSAYLSFFLITKHLWIIALPFLPVLIVSGFLAFPWGKDQPTEIWLLAKIRFMLKPRRRVWDQSGMEELVTITVPKKIEEFVGDNLSEIEVKSRLRALADTIDSRGWAIKNVNVSLDTQMGQVYAYAPSDRLIDAASLPQTVSNVDVQASDDILDEQNNPVAQHLDQMITASSSSHRQQTLKHLDQIRAGQPTTTSQPAATANDQTSPPDYWFVDEPDQSQVQPGYATFGTQPVVTVANDDSFVKATTPLTSDEQALLNDLHAHSDDPSPAYGNTKVIQPLDKQRARGHKQSLTPGSTSQPKTMTQTPDPAILELANNDDLTVATIARQANKKHDGEPPKDEVVISLH